MELLHFATVLPSSQHTATVFLVHGLGDTGDGLKPLARFMKEDPRLDHVKWILPHAPVRPITLHGGQVMPAWYDVYGLNSDKDDEESMLESRQLLSQLISSEIENGIKPERIIIGGFSQGAAMSLLVGLTTEPKLCGLAVLSGRLPVRSRFKSMLYPHVTSIPIFWGHGTADEIVKFERGRASADYLVSDCGVSAIETLGENAIGLFFNSYEGLEHSCGYQELKDLRDWIKLIIPHTE